MYFLVGKLGGNSVHFPVDTGGGILSCFLSVTVRKGAVSIGSVYSIQSTNIREMLVPIELPWTRAGGTYILTPGHCISRYSSFHAYIKSDTVLS